MASPRVFVQTLSVGLVLLAGRAAAAQGVAPPPAARVEAGLEIDIGSLYLFRGLVYSAGPVTQSKAWASWGGLEVYGWTNVAVPAAPGARTLDVIDTGASFAIERKGVAAVTSLDVYMYRLSGAERASGAPAHTIEASLALSYTRGNTTVAAKQIADAGSYRGARFAQLGASHTRALTPRVDLAVTALVGWASRRFTRAYIGPDLAGLSLVTAGVSVTRHVGRLYLRPHLEVSVVPGSQRRAALIRPANVSVGLALGVTR